MKKISIYNKMEIVLADYGSIEISEATDGAWNMQFNAECDPKKLRLGRPMKEGGVFFQESQRVLKPVEETEV